MSALGYIGEVTEDMVGIKVDSPPGPFNDDYVDVILTANLRYLAWATEGASMLAVIVKGGPNYHVYDYVGSGIGADSWLASPLNNAGRIPQISHYNICYKKDPPGEEGQGCTPGYWRNHYDRWLDYTADQAFDTVFGVTYLDDPLVTLGMAISTPQTYGTFAFHAVAALLNSTGGVPNADGTTVDYPYTTAQVIALVQSAVESGDIETTKDLLDYANNLGCPLSGTPACSPANQAACLPLP